MCNVVKHKIKVFTVNIFVEIVKLAPDQQPEVKRSALTPCHTTP